MDRVITLPGLTTQNLDQERFRSNICIFFFFFRLSVERKVSESNERRCWANFMFRKNVDVPSCISWTGGTLIVVTETFFPASSVREDGIDEDDDDDALLVDFQDCEGGHQPGPSVGPFCSDILSWLSSKRILRYRRHSRACISSPSSSPSWATRFLLLFLLDFLPFFSETIIIYGSKHLLSFFSLSS